MKIAILSGKGGTGKTLLAVNLAAAATQATYVDCDVEEPNGRLFFKPEPITTKTVSIKIPYLQKARCDGCRKCVEFCQFQAIAFVQNRPMIFAKVCHACGGCVLVCPRQALVEKDQVIGRIESGICGSTRVISGILNPGEVSGVWVLQKLRHDLAKDESLIFIDGPPGCACTVLESVQDADFCLLVTEPTRLGVHDLQNVHELMAFLGKPCGVVINKDQAAANPVEAYCHKNKLSVLQRIPWDRELAWLSSQGQIAVHVNGKYQKMFGSLLTTLIERGLHETAFDLKRQRGHR